jgi:GR25 family glycosyltransferase involved in LPS biosynthesis
MDRGKTRSRDIHDFPVYVINLKEREDRWKRFKSQPQSATFRNLRRFFAINGKKLDYKRDKRVSLRTKLNITRNYRRSHYEIATLGAVGASLSHISIWKQFLESGQPVCMVFEDDVILTDNQIKDIQRLYNECPSGWGVWLLGCYLPNLIIKPMKGGKWNRVYNFTAAHAYMLTRDAAKALLEQPYPVETHVEYYMTGVSILTDMLIVNTPDVQLEFFHRNHDPRTPESNTSQHKKTGCPVCKIPDDYSQLYRGYTRKTKRGTNILGIVRGEQPKKILNFANTKFRGHSRVAKRNKTDVVEEVKPTVQY